MHWLDTTILAAIGLGAVLGFVSGLFLQVARIASLALAVAATFLFHDPAAHWLRTWALRDAEPAIVDAVAYVAVFVTVYLALFVLTRLLRLWLRATDLAMADRFLGALLGAVKVAVISGAVCLVLRHTAHPAAQACLDRSTLAPTFARGAERAVAMVPDHVKQPVLDSFRQLQDVIARPKEANKLNEPMKNEKRRMKNEER
ncbi:MAG: CvpA family protein [Gemmataceae bacterium]|nr:CvpA family protein [Gemmataceae bacterium]